MVLIQIVQKKCDKNTCCGHIQATQFWAEDDDQKYLVKSTFGEFWRYCDTVSARNWEESSILSKSTPGKKLDLIYWGKVRKTVYTKTRNVQTFPIYIYTHICFEGVTKLDFQERKSKITKFKKNFVFYLHQNKILCSIANFPFFPDFIQNNYFVFLWPLHYTL